MSDINDWKTAHEALERRIMSAIQATEDGLRIPIQELTNKVSHLSGQMVPTYDLYQQLLRSEAERTRLAFEAEQHKALAQAANEDKRRLEEKLEEKDKLIATADERAMEKIKEQRVSRWKYASLIIGTIMGALLLLAYILTHFHFNPGP